MDTQEAITKIIFERYPRIKGAYCASIAIGVAEYIAATHPAGPAVPAVGGALVANAEQDQAHAMPPFAAPASQHGSGASAWISTDDRMPQDGEHVLTYYWPYNNQENDRIIGVAEHIDGTFYNHEGDECHPPSHWMPRPPLPDQSNTAGSAKGGMTQANSAESSSTGSAAAPAGRLDEALANFLAEHTSLNQDGIDTHAVEMAVALNYIAINPVPASQFDEWREQGYIATEAVAVAEGLEQTLIEKRIELTPEYEGEWRANVYLDSDEPQATAAGPTPSAAVAAALARLDRRNA